VKVVSLKSTLSTFRVIWVVSGGFDDLGGLVCLYIRKADSGGWLVCLYTCNGRLRDSLGFEVILNFLRLF
jgi:hypothetical protein